jgi:hypothetical protein
MTKSAAMVAACTPADAGSSIQSARPAADPNVPGATGAYPIPNVVAIASEKRGRESILFLAERGADDTGTCEAVVDATAISAQHRQESETRRHGQHEPDEFPDERVPEVQ